MSKTRRPSAASVRQDFLDFFAERGHRIVPSAPVFAPDDPTLLFTNAGMNQFKDVFLGTGTRDYTRAADTQKCIRVSGKHNDLEEVGRDTYHHTFFEMLGNWSFGDYFKEEAIAWSWELLTGVWGLPKERLWVTVFAGAEGVAADDEAARIWAAQPGLDRSRILRFGKKDNFWEMGETGPCGPCTEIHIDRGGPGTDPADGANPKLGVNAGNERFMELWNNVFIQHNRREDGSLVPLPKKHVDTGMGFERILSVLQGKSSNYDTDLFEPLFRHLSEIAGKPYGKGGEVDVAMRVAADHVRAVTSAMADGALPSNLGRGYVLRRLIRRASRFGRQTLGLEEPFLCELVPAVAEVLGGAFPEIAQRVEHVQLLIRTEEESFARTLGRGIARFDELAAKSGASKRLPGAEAFELYATYGFPEDLVELMARERGLALDQDGWTRAEKAHQDASRAEGKFGAGSGGLKLSVGEADVQAGTQSTYHQTGPADARLETDIVSIALEGQRAVVALRASPFYPESGGQVGDTGTIATLDGRFRLRVEETRKDGAIVVHSGTWEGSAPAAGARVAAVVDAERRDRTRRNHTATHLLHKALKEVLGAHVGQQGSYVGPDRLRFDFSHPKAVTAEELERIEQLVNERVFDNAPVVTTVEKLAAAKARGVVAMFGEKYGESVRVLDVGGWSTELCGGTHVRAAGDIGPFVILSEAAIQAGVRRIEAVTGAEAVLHFQRQRKLLREASRALKTAPDELPARIEALQEQLKAARKEVRSGAQADLGSAFETLKGAITERSGVKVAVLDLPEVGLAGLGELESRAKSLSPDHAYVLITRDGEKVPFLALVGGRAREKGLGAGEIAKRLAGILGGGGGGRPDRAQGQGLSAAGVPQALEEVLADVTAKLGPG